MFKKRRYTTVCALSGVHFDIWCCFPIDVNKKYEIMGGEFTLLSYIRLFST